MSQRKIARYYEKIKQLTEEIVDKLEESTVKEIKRHTGNSKLTVRQGKSVLSKARLELNNKIPRRIIKYMAKKEVEIVPILDSIIETRVDEMKG